MNKLYSVHDHWTDINKKNDVDIESIDGVITGIKVNGEDYGGGITWESVYSGSINPDGEVSPFTADISLTMTAADTIKVIYDNTEYVLSKQVFNEKIYYGAEPASLPADIDFSNCPFLIQVLPDTIRVYTETAGLHTLEISVAQSGGGESDFSTATVTVVWNTARKTIVLYGANFTNIDGSSFGTIILDGDSHGNFEAILYQQKATYEIDREKSSSVSINVSGNAELDEDYIYITGDCTITIS